MTKIFATINGATSLADIRLYFGILRRDHAEYVDCPNCAGRMRKTGYWDAVALDEGAVIDGQWESREISKIGEIIECSSCRYTAVIYATLTEDGERDRVIFIERS